MIDPDKLAVGDVFYSVDDRNNKFCRKKIYREIDGETWFKYDIPRRTYELVTHTVLGILRKKLEGKWSEDGHWDLLTEFYIHYHSKTLSQEYQTDFVGEETKNFFLDKSDALDYIKLMELESQELDKT
jgi:hypothetical protein